MYSILLTTHSLFRWLVLASLLFAIYRAYRGWLYNKPYSKFDDSIRHNTATIAQIQMSLGIWLYCISPIVSYFLHHFKEALDEREIRFFGMEHITMMLIAVIVISIGSAKAKREPNDKQKFKTMAIWFTITLLIIFTSIPWPFSPLISRPYYRMF